jgi:hypothetical protein
MRRLGLWTLLRKAVPTHTRRQHLGDADHQRPAEVVQYGRRGYANSDELHLDRRVERSTVTDIGAAGVHARVRRRSRRDAPLMTRCGEDGSVVGETDDLSRSAIRSRDLIVNSRKTPVKSTSAARSVSCLDAGSNCSRRVERLAVNGAGSEAHRDTPAKVRPVRPSP